MSIIDKMINWAGQGNIEDDDDDYEDGDDGYLDDENEDEEPAPKKKAQKFTSSKQSRSEYEEDEDEVAASPKKSSMIRPGAIGGKVMPMRSTKKVDNGGGMEVCVIKPTSFDEAQEIVETLLKNRTINLNLEGLDFEVAQRIIDFTSGACFAIGGNLMRISTYIFVITPATVPISGDVQETNIGSNGISLNTFMQ